MKLIYLTFAFCSMYCMDNEPKQPYLPSTPMTNIESQEGYFTSLPAEIQQLIFMALADKNTLDEAFGDIRAHALVNTQLNTLINEQWVMKKLIHSLADKFKAKRISIAEHLTLPGAKEYLSRNMAFLKKCWTGKITLKEVEDSVESDIDVNFSNLAGTTILHSIIIHGVAQGQNIVSIIEYLIKHGALVNRRNEPAEGGMTILFAAILTSNTELVKLILDHHDPDICVFLLRDSIFKVTPLELAFRNKLIDIAHVLLEKGAPIIPPDIQNVTLLNLRQYLIQWYGPRVFIQIPDILKRATQELFKKQ